MIPGPILDANVSALERAPRVLAAVRASALPADVDVWTTSQGEVSGRVGGVTLHHAEEPSRDARRWAAEAVDRATSANATRITVVGFALGHHLEALVRAFDGDVVVVEPDAGLLRLALSTRDLSDLLARVEIQTEQDLVGLENSCVVPYAPLRLLGGDAYAAAVKQCELAASRGVEGLRVLVVTPMYGGSHPIALQSHRALCRLGHDAELLDLADFLPSYQKLGLFGARPSRRRVTESLFSEALADGVAARVEEGGFDLVLALAQAPLGGNALEAIRRAGALSALWFVEDRRLFSYWREVAQHYDHVFTIQQGECAAEFRSAGAREVDYLPCAAAPDVHRPLALRAEERRVFGSDVSFVGAGYRNRRQSFRRFLDMDFRLWGSDWERAPEFDRVLQRGGTRVSTEDSVRIWNASKVNLNLHSSTYCDGVEPRGDFVNPRTFEIAASGAFQVVDRRSLLASAFDVGSEVVAVDSVSEMREATRRYLDEPEERARIAEAGRARVLREHTYDHRMESLVAQIVARHPARFSHGARPWTVGDARKEASGAVADYLARFDDATPFTLAEMVRPIPDAEGPLSEPEALFVFLQQFDDLYLSEYRR